MQGVEFSGMSKKSVPPPAASARLPVAAPSHSARPGSLKCRWTSIRPGKHAVRARRFLQRAPGSSGPIAAILPSSIAMSARSVASHHQVSHVDLLQLAQETASPTVQRSSTSSVKNCFIGMMADAAWAAQKQHRRGHAASDNHGIVTRAARHAMNGTSRLSTARSSTRTRAESIATAG